MKDHKTLVIVDMQPHFDAACDTRTQQEIIKLIKEAKSNGDYIIVLEYDLSDWGAHDEVLTFDNIRSAIGTYDDYFLGIKDVDDGSLIVDEIVRDNHLQTNDMIVCGVNAHACVKATALGLANRFQSVTVVGKACNDPYKDPFRWAQIYKRPNLQLIED